MKACDEQHTKVKLYFISSYFFQIEEITTAMSVALESVGASNLPSRSDFVTMKEDLAFREGEVAKSKQTLEGLSAEHTQLKVIKYIVTKGLD